MKRMLYLRELILLGILIILVAYYFIVQGTVASHTEKLEAELSEINSSDNRYLICNMSVNENVYTYGWMSGKPGTFERDSYAVNLSLMSFEYKE